MGLKLHVMCKCICNRVDLIIKGAHVKCVNTYIERAHVFINEKM
jgi:hypothetical protein